MKIEVLGVACEMCDHLEENLKRALKELGLEIKIEHVCDIDKISEYGVRETPALAINGKVKIKGRIPLVHEIKEWIEDEIS